MVTILFITLGILSMWWAAGSLLTGNILMFLWEILAAYYLMRLGWNTAVEARNGEKDR